MFTGIVQELGRVRDVQLLDTGARLTVDCKDVLSDATLGASIAVNGVCVTAVSLENAGFMADLAPETLKRTNLGSLRSGSLVNLERPLLASGRLDGHFVLGHVDGTGKVLDLKELGEENRWLRIEVPEELVRYIVTKGSLAIDGVSLTVAEIEGKIVGFTIIPHTSQHTAIQTYNSGTLVNIEVDIMAKHLEKLMVYR